MFRWAAIGLVVAKTVIAAAGLFIEARYTIPAVPLLEFAVLLGLVDATTNLRLSGDTRTRRAALS